VTVPHIIPSICIIEALEERDTELGKAGTDHTLGLPLCRALANFLTDGPFIMDDPQDEQLVHSKKRSGEAECPHSYRASMQNKAERDRPMA